jgi:hypothetical protein
MNPTDAELEEYENVTISEVVDYQLIKQRHRAARINKWTHRVGGMYLNSTAEADQFNWDTFRGLWADGRGMCE